jgi:hypothetical protein
VTGLRSIRLTHIHFTIVGVTPATLSGRPNSDPVDDVGGEDDGNSGRRACGHTRPRPGTRSGAWHRAKRQGTKADRPPGRSSGCGASCGSSDPRHHRPVRHRRCPTWMADDPRVRCVRFQLVSLPRGTDGRRHDRAPGRIQHAGGPGLAAVSLTIAVEFSNRGYRRSAGTGTS